MKWIEWIRVRSSPSALDSVIPQLEEILQSLRESDAGRESYLLRHETYDGDLCVVIVWNEGKTPHKTTAGFMVAEQLMRIGSIDHSVWIP